MSPRKPNRVTNVPLTISISPRTKRGIKIVAGMLGQTTSGVVEQLCINFIQKWSEVNELLDKKE